MAGSARISGSVQSSCRLLTAIPNHVRFSRERAVGGFAYRARMGLGRSRGLVVRNPGDLSAFALAASGLAIAADPRRTAAALQVQPTSKRGVAETRIGMGGT